MQILQLLKNIPSGSEKSVELASPENCGYLAFSWKEETGAVRIYDVLALQDIACIQAHNNPLALIKFDPSGARIASASTKGGVLDLLLMSRINCTNCRDMYSSF